MNRKQMLKALKEGKKPIDVAIEKWEDILEGKGIIEGSNNCALCHKYDCSYDENTCPLIMYELADKYDKRGFCGGFYLTSSMTYEDKQCMLWMLYITKELMIEDRVY